MNKVTCQKFWCLWFLLGTAFSTKAMQIPVQQDFKQMIAERHRLKEQIRKKERIVDAVCGGVIGCAVALPLYYVSSCVGDLAWQTGSHEGSAYDRELAVELFAVITAPSLLLSVAIVQKWKKSLKHNIVNNLPSVSRVRREGRDLEKLIIARVGQMNDTEWQAVDLSKMNIRFAGRIYAAHAAQNPVPAIAPQADTASLAVP